MTTEPIYTREALLDIHERAHRNFAALLAHCRGLGKDEFDRELPGFGYATVRLQLHHVIGGEVYWLGVLEGRMDVEEDAPDYPTIESLEAYRERIFARTEAYLRAASAAELNTARSMRTWPDRERALVPARVLLRTAAHIYNHIGQVAAMCRLLGKPTPALDFPLE